MKTKSMLIGLFLGTTSIAYAADELETQNALNSPKAQELTPEDEARISAAITPFMLSFMMINPLLAEVIAGSGLLELPVMAKLWEKQNSTEETQVILTEILDEFCNLNGTGGSIISAQISQYRDRALGIALQLYTNPNLVTRIENDDETAIEELNHTPL